MKATLMGFENVSYKSKKNGEQVEGVTMYIAGARSNVVGIATDSKWISRSRNAALCDKILGIKASLPCEVEFLEDSVFGSRFPELVDVVVLE